MTHFENHGLIKIWLTQLRDKNSDSKTVQTAIFHILTLMTGSIFKDVALTSKAIETPIAEFNGSVSRDKMYLVLILRAALAMDEPITSILPDVTTIHIGMKRHHFDSWECYYDGLQQLITKRPSLVQSLTTSNNKFYVADVMFATGNSAFRVFDLLKQVGILENNIVFIAIIASEHAMKELKKQYPEIKVYCATVDNILNNKNYIVPGLGDAGDRVFNTD